MIVSLDNQLIFKALAFASEKHRFQFRKGREHTPYIHHPIQVANLISNVGKVEDVATLCAALLHDTVEDTKTSKTELQNLFGSEIKNLVIELTDDKFIGKEECKRLQVCNAKNLSGKAKLVRLADKISNVFDMGHFPPEYWDNNRKTNYLKWSKMVVDELRGINGALEMKFDVVFENSLEIINAVHAQ